MNEETKRADFKEKITFGTSLLSVGALLSIVGSFMAWASMGMISVSGSSGDGKITAICGLAVLVGIVFVFNRERKRGVVTAILSFILALLILFTVTYDGTNIARAASSAQWFSASTGTGIYVVFLGGLLVALGSIAILTGVSKDNFYKLGELAKGDLIKFFSMVILMLATIGGAYATAKTGQDEVAATDERQPGIGISRTATEPAKKPELKVLSRSAKTGTYSTNLEIMGEIENVGEVDAYSPKVSITLMSKGQVVATSQYSELPEMIPQGMIAPYKASISSAPAYDEIKVEVEAGSQSYQKYQYLKVLSQNPRSEDHGGYFYSLYVAGEVQNDSDYTVGSYSGPKVTAWLLDASNNVVEVGFTYLDNPVKSGEKQPYEVTFSFDETAPQYSTIKVLALGAQTGGPGTGRTNSSTSRMENS